MSRRLLFLCLAACGSPSSPNGTIDAPAGSGAVDAPLPPMVDATPMPTQSVSIIVEPNGNKGSELVAAINAATKSVYMTMYQIDSSPVLAALVARKQAGLDVQVILDGSTTCKSFNTPAYNQLHNAGIAVVWSNSTFTYTHEKNVMIEGT
jgi:phosphatidylserine/phosphatidylglycerophosphate/cardiolipin synthase-like enzyme